MVAGTRIALVDYPHQDTTTGLCVRVTHREGLMDHDGGLKPVYDLRIVKEESLPNRGDIRRKNRYSIVQPPKTAALPHRSENWQSLC